MKKQDIINAVNALYGLKITKIKNDKVKFSLVADYRILRKVAREFEEDQKEIIKKFQADFASELEKVQKLRASGELVTGHDTFLKAEKDTNRFLADMAQEDCKVEGLKFVNLEDFLKAVPDSELSMEDISYLDGIIIK